MQLFLQFNWKWEVFVADMYISCTLLNLCFRALFICIKLWSAVLLWSRWIRPVIIPDFVKSRLLSTLSPATLSPLWISQILNNSFNVFSRRYCCLLCRSPVREDVICSTSCYCLTFCMIRSTNCRKHFVNFCRRTRIGVNLRTILGGRSIQQSGRTGSPTRCNCVSIANI